MILLSVVHLEEEKLVMQNHLAIVILHNDPEALHKSVHLLVPLEVGGQGEIHLQHRTRDGLNVRAELDPRELMHELVNRLAHLGEANQLPNLLRGQVIVSLPRKILALYLDQNVLRNTLELSQRGLASPRATSRHFAHCQGFIREPRPPALENDLKDAPKDAPSRLRDVHHISHQCEAFELHAADVRL